MTMEISQQSFAPGWTWLSKDSAQVGMQLHAAFLRFSQAANANPANANYQLTALRNHSHSTVEPYYGYLWRLGHPEKPYLYWLLSSNTTQGSAAMAYSDYNMRFDVLEAGRFMDVPGAYGYGSVSSSGSYSYDIGRTYFSRWQSAYLDTRTQFTGLSALLIIAQDTTANQEWFCWTLSTTGHTTANLNAGELFRPLSQILWRTPLGWAIHTHAVWSRDADPVHSFGPMRDAAGNLSFARMIFAHNLNEGLVNEWFQVLQLRNRPQLHPSGTAALAVSPTIHDFPPGFFVGSGSGVGGLAAPMFRKITLAGSTLMQLGARGFFDLYIEVPHDATGRSDGAWQPVLGSSRWSEAANNNVIWAPPPTAPTTVSAAVDFRTFHPLASAQQVQMHPYASRLLSGDSGGGSGGGSGGSGGGSSGSQRPAAGLLWPRSIPG